MQNVLGATLTPREKEMMHLLAQHYTYEEICEALGISIRTVNRHIENIAAKTGVHGQRYLERHAIEQGYGMQEVPA